MTWRRATSMCLSSACAMATGRKRSSRIHKTCRSPRSSTSRRSTKISRAWCSSSRPTPSVATNTDAHTREADPALIDAFRKRVGDGNEQTAAIFDTPDRLELAVSKAFSEFKSKREKGSALLGSGANARHPAELRTDMMVICTGTDSKTHDSINTRSDVRFRAEEISPDDAQYLLSLDRAARNARGLCSSPTPALNRFAARGALLEAALRVITERCGQALLLLDGATDADLPNGLLNVLGARVRSVAATGIGDPTSDALKGAYQKVREYSPSIANDRRVGVPCVVVALTASTVGNFALPAANLFGRFKQAQRGTRQTQFNDLQNADSQAASHVAQPVLRSARGRLAPLWSGRAGERCAARSRVRSHQCGPAAGQSGTAPAARLSPAAATLFVQTAASTGGVHARCSKRRAIAVAWCCSMSWRCCIRTCATTSIPSSAASASPSFPQTPVIRRTCPSIL